MSSPLSKPKRYSFTNGANTSTHQSSLLPSNYPRDTWNYPTKTEHPPMMNDYLNDVPRPDRKHFAHSFAKPQHWTIRYWCLICSMATVGVFVPLLVISSGAITLDSFNDVVRYLPGYIYFANNFLSLISMLLLVSFATLAWFPTWKGLLLGLPLHLLIVFIFRRLLDEWIPWCLIAYALMVLAPAGLSIFMYIKTATRYLDPTTLSFCETVLGPAGQRIESALFLLSHNNRSAWPRFWIGFLLALSFAVPVVVNNERRHFNPAQADPRFDILRPEPLCPAPLIPRKGGLSHVSEGAFLESEEKTFDDYWQEYLILHRSMVVPEDQGGVPLSKKKFLVFTPTDDGLGNRLQALLSTVVLAMVTKRAIVLDWRASPQCNAEFLDLFKQPDGIAWDLASVRYNLYDATTAPLSSMPGEWLPYCRSCLIRKPISPASSWSRLLCGADLGMDETQPWLQILSTQWFLPVIQHNPFWRAELCRIFPEGGRNAFQLLAKKLLRPSSVVQDKIDQVMDRIPKGATLIGLQVRRTENNAVGDEIEEAFLGCADQVVEEEIEKSDMAWIARQKLGSTASKKQRLPSELEELWVEREKRKHQPRFAYFLATDYHRTRTHFQDILGDELFVLENTFDVLKQAAIPKPSSVQSTSPVVAGAKPTTLPQREAVARNSVLGVQNAVAEMLLLAQADRIISSPYSTFGYFAHGYANVQSNVVKRDGTCIRRKSTQPCFQYWFGFANGGAMCPIKATIEMSEDYDCWL